VGPGFVSDGGERLPAVGGPAGGDLMSTELEEKKDVANDQDCCAFESRDRRTRRRLGEVGGGEEGL